MRGVAYEVKKWCETRKSKVDIHIFGFARPRLITELQKMGITSFDSASFLRSAWLSGGNYFTPKEKYRAIRVPDPRRSTRTSRIMKERRVSKEELEQLSERVIGSLRRFEQGKESVEHSIGETENRRTGMYAMKNLKGFLLAASDYSDVEAEACYSIDA